MTASANAFCISFVILLTVLNVITIFVSSLGVTSVPISGVLFVATRTSALAGAAEAKRSAAAPSHLNKVVFLMCLFF